MRSMRIDKGILILVVAIISSTLFGQNQRPVDSSELDRLNYQIKLSQDSITHLLEEKPEVQNELFSFISDSDQNLQATEANRASLKRSQNILLGLVIICVIISLTFFFMKSREVNQIRAHKRQEDKLKAMLSRLIPESQVDHLLHNEKVDPVMWKECAIMFVELDELTPYNSPQHRLEVIDHLFQVAENLFKEYDLQKIKTSGQQILAVCKKGRLTPVQQVEATVQCAVKLRESLRYVKDPRMSIRVGISYGDVISGLIGTEKVRFDIWGADVNIAYRNVQYAMPGKINVSKYVMRSLNKSKYTVEDLGAVEIKEGQSLEMFAV